MRFVLSGDGSLILGGLTMHRGWETRDDSRSACRSALLERSLDHQPSNSALHCRCAQQPRRHADDVSQANIAGKTALLFVQNLLRDLAFADLAPLPSRDANGLVEVLLGGVNRAIPDLGFAVGHFVQLAAAREVQLVGTGLRRPVSAAAVLNALFDALNAKPGGEARPYGDRESARRIAEILIWGREGAQPGEKSTVHMPRDSQSAAPRMLRSDIG